MGSVSICLRLGDLLNDIQSLVLSVVSEKVCAEGQVIEVALDHHLIEDLNLSSLGLAAVIARLEFELDDEPFAQRHTLASIRTVADLARVFGEGP